MTEHEKHKVEIISDSLLDATEPDGLKDALAGDPAGKAVYSLLKNISFPTRLMQKADGDKETVWQETYGKMYAAKRRRRLLTAVSMAASILVLMGLTGYLSFRYASASAPQSQLVSVETPLGTTSGLTLPDGTVVRMNAGSKLVYPSAFTSATRQVEASGELFFDVAHNKEMPFIVRAGNLNIKVIGTQFNVKAYGGSEDIKITLDKGKIKVGAEQGGYTVDLDPGEQATYRKSDRSFSKQAADARLETSWMRGDLHFSRMTLRDIADELERKFNVTIAIESDEISHKLFSGDFVRNENIGQILDIIVSERELAYKTEGRKVHIYTKNG